MTKKKAALLIASCVALTACADNPKDRSILEPRVQPSLDESASAAIPATPFGTDEALPHAPRIGNARAATGGFANGHFELSAPFGSILTEQYSFTALSTEAFPNAKGQLEAKIARATNFQDLHADIDCIVINGNEAWMSGPITRLIVNGVEQPPNGRQVAWRVRDNGEGANSPPDMGTVLFQGFPQACLIYFWYEDLPLLPTANGNIRVWQR